MSLKATRQIKRKLRRYATTLAPKFRTHFSPLYASNMTTVFVPRQISKSEASIVGPHDRRTDRPND